MAKAVIVPVCECGHAHRLELNKATLVRLTVWGVISDEWKWWK